MSVIVCICLHPAIDRTLELATPLEPGRLQRTVRVLERAGGKGVNVASVMQQLGAEALAVLPVAGGNGARLQRMLEADGIPNRALRVAGETRETQTILDGTGHPTEVYESGPVLTAGDLTRLEALIPSNARWLIVSGSLAPGLSPIDFQAWLRGLRARFRVAVDTSGAALLAALEAGVNLVKPNSAELKQLGTTASDAFMRYGVSVLHSRGADGLEYVGPEGHIRQTAFRVDAINPVGAGDATLAGFVLSLERGERIECALRHATACGAAACLEPTAGAISPERVRTFLEALEVSHA